MVLVAVLIYAVAMTVANLLVARFGPAVTPINAFVLIGLDLALRDWLHVRLTRQQMLALVVSAGALTYALAPAAQIIAVASAAAFVLASAADWMVFSRLKGTWTKRSLGSNVVGAAVDSLVFPTIAFGALMPAVVAWQFAGKVAGGALWTWVIGRLSPGLATRRISA